MSGRNDLTNNGSNGASSRYYVDSSYGQRSTNTPLRKTPSIPTQIGTTKSNSFFSQNNSNHDSNLSNSHYSNQNQSNISHNYQNKNSLKTLTIETTEESASYNVVHNNQLNSYSATHNSANYYSFNRNNLISSLNGNLTTKYSKASDNLKSNNFVSPTKTLTNSKPVLNTNYLSSTGVHSSHNTSSNSALMSTLSPTNYHFKNYPSKNSNYEGLRSPVQLTSPSSQNQIRLSSGGPNSQNSNNNNQQSQTNLMSNQTPNAQQNSTSQANLQSLLSKTSNLNRNTTPTPTNTNESNNNNSTAKLQNTSLNTSSTSLNTSTNQIQNNLKNKLQTPLPNHEPTKCSVKRNGIVKAYAANTNQGIVRNYNEDRVSIILNIMKPASRVNEEWPKCSFFGVYDGHGGVTCADFLRDNLHQYVIKESSFPWNPKEALMRGFDAAEKAFIELAQNQQTGEIDRSGSCAIVVLIVGDMCYVANVGDSRAVMSGEGGQRIFPLSKDHKPMDDQEQKRIIEAGGRIYQTQAPALRQAPDGGKPQMQILTGPHRVFPGRLSVSRTFGDIEAKLTKFGGNPNVVIATPDIKAFRITNDHDFIILASDGIYDKLSSRDVLKSVWESSEEKAQNVHHQCGLAVENILRESINRRSLDNITVVMIGFKNFKQKLFPRDKSGSKTNNENLEQDDDISVMRSPSSKTITQTSFAFKPSYKHSVKERQDENSDLSHNRSHSMNKRESFNTEGNDSKKVLTEKTPLSDLNNTTKRLSSGKRVSGNHGLSESQKFESLKGYHGNNGTYKSMDYRNGELARQVA